MIPSIEIHNIISRITPNGSLHSVITVSDIDETNYNELPVESFSLPVRLNAMIIGLVSEGYMQMIIDGVTYKVEAGDLLTLVPLHVVQACRPSPGFKGQLMAGAHADIVGCMPSKRNFNPIQILKNPCTRLNPQEIERVRDGLNRIRTRIEQHSHSFRKELIINAFQAFCLDLGDILICRSDHSVGLELSRKEEILHEFIRLILINVRKEHTVTFYAGQLCITPQYLSLVLKELTGKSASRWIDEALLHEARVMLKTPKMTIQQVADKLSFSDQSTFGKFFKKNSGLSPMEYRRS
ncbi:MAG: helix-turn-helix transcriptional regulator [Tannerellaceae bacterium]|jgi:AraC-like DNA-binding protein|nr:helix-turn-helix transcriptional regulator [Tannerellaceae bacterium]